MTHSIDNSLDIARRVILIEAKALSALADSLNSAFEAAVELMLSCRGRVVVTGVGKSGLIGNKIASTFSSTGTPASFLHPVDAIHGDLGVLVVGDVFLAVSNSGETEEILRVLPAVKRRGAKLISITGNARSTLAQESEVVLEVKIKEEACPLGLAPTTSTTAALALGDALAVALLVRRGFKAEDFALLHPGGTLGRKLLLRVRDLMHGGDRVPLAPSDTLMNKALFTMTACRLGVVGVTEGERLVGVITDGDLRRALERGLDVLTLAARDLMTRNPKRIEASELAATALRRMEDLKITSLFVVEDSEPEKPVGVIHLHDLLKAGLG